MIFVAVAISHNVAAAISHVAMVPAKQWRKSGEPLAIRHRGGDRQGSGSVAMFRLQAGP